MLLTCPTCASGLQVPDGTTAMVRCPACKTVFSADAGLTLPDDEPEPDDEPRHRRHHDEEDDEDDRPRGKAKEPKPDNRDFDPIDPDELPRRRRRREEDDEENKLSPEERAALKAAFARAAWGTKLVWIAFALFLFSMLLIIAYYFQLSFKVEPSPAFIIGAGAIGAVYWTLGAVGVGLCLSGPVSPGHWRYGIAAAVATGMHLILLAVLVGQGNEVSHDRGHREDLEIRWSLVPTQLETLTFYLTFLFYRDEDLVPKIQNALPVVVGAAEMVRNVLILMLLSCLARAAGDNDLSHECTRAAGFASFGPGILALVTFLCVVALVETNAQYTTFAKIAVSTLGMGIYAILSGMLLPAMMAARATADACDEPFQSQIPKL